MKHFLAILFSLSVGGHLLAQGNDPAALLRSALKATEKLDTVEYEVKQVFKTPDGKLHHYRSTIVAARSPLGFSARFEDQDTGTRDMAVLDGEVTRYSDEGIAGEVTKTFTVAGQVVPNHLRSSIDLDQVDRDGRSDGFMLGAGFLAMRVQVDVDVAEESGTQVHA